MVIIDRLMRNWRVTQPIALKRKYAADLIEMIERRVEVDPHAEVILRKYLEELQPWIGKEKGRRSQ